MDSLDINPVAPVTTEPQLPTMTRSWVDRYALALLLGILAVAALLRVFQLGTIPLWVDETATLRFADRPFSEFFTPEAMREPNPPLYYMMARVWLLAFGDSEIAIRSLPVIIGVLTVGIVFGFGRTLGGNRVGLIAALLLATSGIHIWYSQEARAYIVLAMLATLAAWATCILVTQPALASRFSARSIGLWAGYVVCCILALYTHNTAILLPALCGLAMAVVWLPRREHRAGLVIAALVAHAFIIAAWLFWASNVIQHSVETLRDWHIPKPSAEYVISELRRAYGQFGAGINFAPPIKLLIDLPYLLVAAIGFIALRKHPRLLVVLGGVVIGLPLLVTLISFSRPILMTRIVLWPLPTFVIVVAFGVMASRKTWWHASALALILVIQVFGLHQYYTSFDKGEPWDEVVALVGNSFEPGDKVAVWPQYIVEPVGYYRPSKLDQEVIFLLQAEGAASQNNRYYVRNANSTEIAFEDASNWIKQHPRVWIIARVGDNDLPPYMEIETERIVESHRFQKVKVVLIANTDGSSPSTPPPGN